MPRNGSGTSSVINTFVIDTVADPDEVNANFTDVADQLTNSLPRDGQAGMNAPLPLQNGTAALPALTFTSDPDTGIYRESANKVGLALGGVGYPLDIGVVYAAKSGNYTAVATDNNAVHRYTAAATVTLTAAATLGANWHYTIIADGGDVTIDPNGAETIDGAATLVVPNGYSLLVICSGSAFFTNKLVSLFQSITFGQCRLSLSGGNILLSRFNGPFLTINGAHYSIPSAGITLAATGLTPATLYYIYAYMNSGTMTLEASATGHSVDATTGVEIKTGDATRTLVGMARPITGPAWADTDAQRFVVSWFNRVRKRARNSATSSQTTASTSYVEPYSSNRAEFLCWADLVDCSLQAAHFNSAAGNSMFAAIGIDGTATIAAEARAAAPVGNYEVSLNCNGTTIPTEGYHYATMLAKTSAGTSTIYGVGLTQAVTAEFAG